MPTADPRNMKQPPDNHRYDMTWKELRGIYPSHEDSWETRAICRRGNRYGTSYAATEEAAPTSIQKANNIFNNSLSVRAQGEWKPLFSTTAHLPRLRENRTPLGSAPRGKYFYKA
ncbi:hypothetical protein V6N12_061994 [Hibiscus sabdariffa]|uniref:Uncharacterized protein n=1 Tax=Hibiscus sabdariffa TaxID=183260 RepID=A0ABR2DZU9_9ROSI